MGYTEFFSSKQTRGSKQPYIKNIILGTQKQQTSSQLWINQEKIGKISPNGGMAKLVLWRVNQRSKPLRLKSTLQGVTKSNMSQNQYCFAFHFERRSQPQPLFFLPQNLYPLYFFSSFCCCIPTPVKNPLLNSLFWHTKREMSFLE